MGSLFFAKGNIKTFFGPRDNSSHQEPELWCKQVSLYIVNADISDIPKFAFGSLHPIHKISIVLAELFVKAGNLKISTSGLSNMEI